MRQSTIEDAKQVVRAADTLEHMGFTHVLGSTFVNDRYSVSTKNCRINVEYDDRTQRFTYNHIIVKSADQLQNRLGDDCK